MHSYKGQAMILKRQSYKNNREARKNGKGDLASEFLVQRYIPFVHHRAAPSDTKLPQLQHVVESSNFRDFFC